MTVLATVIVALVVVVALVATATLWLTSRPGPVELAARTERRALAADLRTTVVRLADLLCEDEDLPEWAEEEVTEVLEHLLGPLRLLRAGTLAPQRCEEMVSLVRVDLVAVVNARLTAERVPGARERQDEFLRERLKVLRERARVLEVFASMDMLPTDGQRAVATAGAPAPASEGQDAHGTESLARSLATAQGRARKNSHLLPAGALAMVDKIAESMAPVVRVVTAGGVDPREVAAARAIACEHLPAVIAAHLDLPHVWHDRAGPTGRDADAETADALAALARGAGELAERVMVAATTSAAVRRRYLEGVHPERGLET